MMFQCFDEDDRTTLLQQLSYVNRHFYKIFGPKLESCKVKHMTQHYQSFEFRFDNSESLKGLDLLLNQPNSDTYIQKVTIMTGSLLRPKLGFEKVSVAPEAVEILDMVVREDRFRRALSLLSNLTTLVIDQPEDVQDIKNCQVHEYEGRCQLHEYEGHCQLCEYKGHCQRLIDNIASFIQDLSLTSVNILGVDGSPNAPGATPIVARNGTQIIYAVRKSQLTEFLLSTFINKHSGKVPATFMRIYTNIQSSYIRS
jgi:hypothetical protein